MKKILIVEDDPFLIDIYTTKLKDSGFSVEVAKEGESALRKLTEEKFDLLLLDIVLPQIDGWEILGKIKNAPHQYGGARLKIVILSNLGQKEEVEKGLKLGATKYLIKAHHTPSEVVEEIKAVLK
ncbi:MAG: response regulator [Candidatus Nealsonbacteria bacterium CG_4_8_14_3_um_filter_37_36]|uniref:Response regulator n=2 Tax=Candidatus Nealsoniibacteriota TaxID=1817911 RepID=A0A2H9N1F2_9BACT|nr:MAG: response regulator [Candidatus Nealsonbacteria bacterium CG_4_8_14_3_um_filter_37_36]PJA82746.1 MAG: response regulator [Candidatus Nealsonbacteria bacterium CG_4_9_14_3_um_filter_37_29]